MDDNEKLVAEALQRIGVEAEFEGVFLPTERPKRSYARGVLPDFHVDDPQYPEQFLEVTSARASHYGKNSRLNKARSEHDLPIVLVDRDDLSRIRANPDHLRTLLVAA